MSGDNRSLCKVCNAPYVNYLGHAVRTGVVAGFREANSKHIEEIECLRCENALVEEVAERIVREKGHRRRLDYILVGPPLLYSGYARVETCRVVLDRPCDGVWASGHFGVFAELSLYSQ